MTTLYLESISTIPFPAGTSYVKILQWGQHSYDPGNPCLVSIFGTLWGTNDQPNENPGVLVGCQEDIFFNITNFVIQLAGMLITQKIGQVSFVGCLNDWNNSCSSRMQNLRIPPTIARVYFAIYSAVW